VSNVWESRVSVGTAETTTTMIGWNPSRDAWGLGGMGQASVGS